MLFDENFLRLSRKIIRLKLFIRKHFQHYIRYGLDIDMALDYGYGKDVCIELAILDIKGAILYFC
jgi:hypothetical protein